MAVVRNLPIGSIYSRPNTRKLWVRFPAGDGSEVRKSSGVEDPDQAQAFLEAELRRQTDLTFREAVVDFFEVKSRNLKPKTLVGYKQNLKTIDKFFGNEFLADIGRLELQRFVGHRRRSVSDTTVRRELAFLSTVITHAIDAMPNGPEHNPVTAFSKKSMKEKTRDRWLSSEEYQRLLDACWIESHRDIIQFACMTGMRHGELTALRKPMFQIGNRRLILPGSLTKNGTPRVVPLAPAALRTAKKLCGTSPGELFFWFEGKQGKPTPYSSFRGFFGSARIRAGLNDVRFHDLRHTFASWYVQAGGQLETLQRLLGHGSMQMVQRYAYLDMRSAHQQADEVFQEAFPHSFRTEEENDPHSLT